jgi:acylphosphatase
MDRVTVVITGSVQGVGFRWYVLQAARALGLTGEVRNRTDGAVVVEAEGAHEALERLLEAAREGPVMATVGQVDVSWSAGAARFPDFRIGRTG